MKNKIFALVLSSVFITGFSQELKFQVRLTHEHTIIKEKLTEAMLVRELVPYNTGPGLITYVSTEIISNCDGKTLVAKGVGDVLSAEQRGLLGCADLNSDLVININFVYNKNFMPGDNKLNTLKYIANVSPEIEGEYPTGYFQMGEYFRENVISKISGADSKNIPFALVNFSINDKGNIESAKIVVTTENPEIDQLLLDAVNKMPKWTPAQDSKGTKIKRNFDFIIGTEINKNGC